MLSLNLYLGELALTSSLISVPGVIGTIGKSCIELQQSGLEASLDGTLEQPIKVDIKTINTDFKVVSATSLFMVSSIKGIGEYLTCRGNEVIACGTSKRLGRF